MTEPAGRRVLVVEDNVDSAETLAEILVSWGHAVTIAADGPAALAAADASIPQVVLLDIGLPGMDGYEVARRLRADARFDGTRIVALSGYGYASHLERAAQSGIDEHLLKPVDFDRLRAILVRGPD
jgi:CheY-like chemotaxis protein